MWITIIIQISKKPAAGELMINFVSLTLLVVIGIRETAGDNFS
jgi:hypothetical protein